MTWHSQTGLQARTYVCGYCFNTVGSDRGWSQQPTTQGQVAGVHIGALYLCPVCDKPSYFKGSERIPGVPLGHPVEHVPDEVNKLYNEARTCCASSAYTASVLLCRKLLMNIAVSLKADPGRPFIYYVEHLADQGYVPPNGRTWVDHIRKKGNEATHEIQIMAESDAKDIIAFAEMLLKFIFEFPNKVPPP